jgi:hypothetical protein
MNDHAAEHKRQDAQLRVLLQEFRNGTGDAAKSAEEAEKWFAGLSQAERDRIGSRLNDPDIVGRHLQTPSMD